MKTITHNTIADQQKWFYPLQNEIKAKIATQYDRFGYCDWQEVTKDK